jgi:hypothetical protein
MTESVVIDYKCTPNTFLLFAILCKALFHQEHPDIKEYSTSLIKDSSNILYNIGAIDQGGSNYYYDSDNFRHAWLQNDLDWFHAQFMQIQNYRDVILAVKQGNIDTLHGKNSYLNLARKLGQITRIDPASNIFVGDRLIDDSTIISYLSKIMPNIGDRALIYDVCGLFSSAGITPYRFSREFKRLMKSHSFSFPFEAKALGIRQPGYEEEVIHLTAGSFTFEPSSSGRFKTDGILYYTELVRVI